MTGAPCFKKLSSSKTSIEETNIEQGLTIFDFGGKPA